MEVQMGLEINIMLVVVLGLVVFKIVTGYKQGMVKEIISFVSLIITCIVVVLIGAGLHSYMDKQIVGIIITVVLLAIVGIVHHLLNIVFFSAKVISKLPIISWADKLLGMVVGVAEVVILLWTLYILMGYFDLGEIEAVLVENTNNSRVLTLIKQYNFFSPLVEQVLAQMQ